jgi:NAD(P)-dependent dehydrogenase (short-subunit alcohol dehydrogenase family)
MSENRVAWITGAAGGIGKAIALELAGQGHDLCLTDLDPAALAAVAQQAERLGVKAWSAAGDLGDLGFVQRFVDQAVGVPNVLVNNAAWRELVTMREISVDSWERTLRVCLTAPAFLARSAAARMEPLRRGVIINVSSMMSGRASGIAPAYVAAKGALDALTYDLAALYGPSGIRVVAVNPGAVDTALSPDDDKLRDFTNEMISLRRWAKPEEIARAVAWLASDAASYLTGTTIVIDGGWSRQLYPYGLKQAMKPDQFP